MKLLAVLLIAVVATASAVRDRNHHKEYMLKQNKLPKQIADAILIRTPDGLTSLSDIRRAGESTNRVFGSACDACKETVGKFKELIQDKTKLEELKMMLKMVCDLMGSRKEECKELVENLDDIVKELGPIFDNPETLCTELHFCGSNDNIAKINRVALLYVKQYFHQLDGVNNRANNLVCDECEFAMTEVKTLLKDKDVRNEVIAFVHQICGYLGGDYGQMCNNLADTYLPQFFDELENLLANPKLICSEIGLCSGTHRRRTEADSVRGQPLFRGDTMGTDRSVASVHDRLPRPGTPRLDSFKQLMRTLQTRSGHNAGCTLCRLGLTTVMDLLKTDQMLAKLSNTIKEVACEKVLPDDFEPGCADFLDLYLKTVLYMSFDQLQPEKFCTLIHACTAANIRELLRIPEQRRNGMVCEACETVFEFVHAELSERPLQRDICQKLKGYCTYLPQTYRAECEQRIDQYVPNLLDTLDASLQPSVVCPMLHLCRGNGRRVGVRVYPQEVNEVDEEIMLI